MKLGHLMILILALTFGVALTIFYVARTAHLDALRLQEQREIHAYALLEESCRLTWPKLGNRYVACLTQGDNHEQ